MTRPDTSDEPSARILPFRPRGSLFARNPPPVPDLRKFEQSGDDPPDDFRHRMAMNALVFAITLGLIAGGIWIADVIAQMRKHQDCALVGRLNCNPVQTPVNAPPQPR